jgi:hypothetical protein
MTAAQDHRLDIYVDSVLYLALRQRASSEDRSVSQHVRHLIREDIERFISSEAENGNGSGGVIKGDSES